MLGPSQGDLGTFQKTIATLKRRFFGFAEVFQGKQPPNSGGKNQETDVNLNGFAGEGAGIDHPYSPLFRQFLSVFNRPFLGYALTHTPMQILLC
jgi:hypothetical protein